MFIHVVMFKAKDSKDIPLIANTLRSMEGKIPEIRYMEVGLNEITSDRNFDVILYTKFDNRQQMDIYQVSDYHQNKVLSVIKPYLEKTVACDYIVDEKLV